MNLYRGCVHGCIYCDSRSTCYQVQKPFEDIAVKENAPFLLESALRRKKTKAMISTGSMSDPYQPCEKELGLTRTCLEIIDRYGFGATVITKSDLVLRDLDLFQRINEHTKSVLQMTLTIADEELSTKLEPNVCTTKDRLEVIRKFRASGIPVVVWLTPVLPFLTDTEENISQILDWCFDADVAGIICFNMGMTLREGSREYFYHCLENQYPGLSQVYNRKFGSSYEIPSPKSRELLELFHRKCEEHHLLHTPEDCFRFIAQMPAKQEQLTLF